MPLGMAAATALSGGLSMGGGLFGSIVQAKQAREQRKWQTKENQLQRDFESSEAGKARAFEQYMYDHQFATQSQYGKEMLGLEQGYDWQKLMEQEEYNSAASQRERLEAAGLNPYLMLSGGNAGTISGGSSPSVGASTAGAPSSPQAHAPSIGSYQQPNLGGFIAGLGQNFATGVEAFIRSKQAKDLISQPGIQNADIAADASLKQANMIYMYLKADYQEVLNRFATPRQQAELAEIGASIFARMQAGQLSHEQAISELAAREKMYAEANNIKIRNNLYGELANGIVDAYKAQFSYNKAYYKAEEGYISRNAFNRAERLAADLKYLQDQIKFLSSKKDLTEQERKNLERYYRMMPAVLTNQFLQTAGQIGGKMMPFMFPNL